MHTHRLRTDALFPEVLQHPEVGYFSSFLDTLGTTFPRIPHFLYGMDQRCQQWSWGRSGTWKWGGCHSDLRFIVDKRFWEVILRSWGALGNLLALLLAAFLPNLPFLTGSTLDSRPTATANSSGACHIQPMTPRVSSANPSVLPLQWLRWPVPDSLTRPLKSNLLRTGCLLLMFSVHILKS